MRTVEWCDDCGTYHPAGEHIVNLRTERDVARADATHWETLYVEACDLIDAKVAELGALRAAVGRLADEWEADAEVLEDETAVAAARAASADLRAALGGQG